MNISSINFSNSGQYKKYNSKTPSFKSVIRVSDIEWNDRLLLNGKKYNSIIDKAIKILKDPDKKNMDFVKKFWDTVTKQDSSKVMQRSKSYIIQGRPAERLADVSAEIPYINGDTQAYKNFSSDIISDKKLRLKTPDGKEQEAVIIAHQDKKRVIQIDDIFFKPKGQRYSKTTPKPLADTEIQPSALGQKVQIPQVMKKPESKLLNPLPDWPARVPQNNAKTVKGEQQEFDFS